MSYLDTPHKRKSLVITIVLHMVLLLLLFFVGMAVKEPEDDGGIAINFGNNEFGKGELQSFEPIESAPTSENVPEEVIEEIQEESEIEEASLDEEVVAQDDVEAPVIEKKEIKKVSSNKKEVKKIKEPVVVPEKKRTPKPVEKKPDASTKNALSSFLNGYKSSGVKAAGEGNDNIGGDKGDPNGDPNSKSYYGTGTGLDGDGNYRLGGRKALGKERNIPKCNETGTVVVKIVVDQTGKVIQATPGIKGTTNAAECLMEPAKKAALATKFNSDSKAPSRQIGSIVYTFKLSE